MPDLLKLQPVRYCRLKYRTSDTVWYLHFYKGKTEDFGYRSTVFFRFFT